MANPPKKPVPDPHTVVRKVSKTRWVKDQKTGQPKPLPQAFELRVNEEYLSASWLEHAGGTKDECLKKTVNTLRNVTNIPLGEPCAYALGTVADIKATCLDFGKAIRIVHEAKSNNPAYAAVRQIGPNNLELMERLASKAWATLVLNRDIA